jgi:23S rRNA (cytosine1962-C5)-methyltransferase
MTPPRPILRLLPSRHKRVAEGHPWVYSNEAQMDAVAKAIPPGTVVKVAAANGQMLGSAFFNPHSLIAARMLSRDAEAEIGVGFLSRRLRAAPPCARRYSRDPFTASSIPRATACRGSSLTALGMSPYARSTPPGWSC